MYSNDYEYILKSVNHMKSIRNWTKNFVSSSFFFKFQIGQWSCVQRTSYFFKIRIGSFAQNRVASKSLKTDENNENLATDTVPD